MPADSEAVFYGRGMAYPVHLDAGGIGESSGTAKVDEAIRIILGTGYGERVMRPDFGSNLRSLVFAPNNTATANLARYYTDAALRRWEPRIDVLDVAAVPDNPHGLLTITIRYRLKATQDLHSLIYPFYLQGQ